MMCLPEFWRGTTPPPEYYSDIDPLAPPQDCPFDLPALSKYAAEHGVSVADLSREEVMRFVIKPLPDWMV